MPSSSPVGAPVNANSPDGVVVCVPPAPATAPEVRDCVMDDDPGLEEPLEAAGVLVDDPPAVLDELFAALDELDPLVALDEPGAADVVD